VRVCISRVCLLCESSLQVSAKDVELVVDVRRKVVREFVLHSGNVVKT